jgi:hypothetical protein
MKGIKILGAVILISALVISLPMVAPKLFNSDEPDETISETEHVSILSNEITAKIENKDWNIAEYKRMKSKIAIYQQDGHISLIDKVNLNKKLDRLYVATLAKETDKLFTTSNCSSSNFSTIKKEVARFYKNKNYTSVLVNQQAYFSEYDKAKSLIRGIYTYCKIGSNFSLAKTKSHFSSINTQLRNSKIRNCISLKSQLEGKYKSLESHHKNYLQGEINSLLRSLKAGKPYDYSMGKEIRDRNQKYVNFNDYKSDRKDRSNFSETLLNKFSDEYKTIQNSLIPSP